jgi:hypothetical protein
MYASQRAAPDREIMMRKIAFVLEMFAISAAAADFRAVDFGQYCSTIPEWEASHGSSPTPWPKPHVASYAFRVQRFDRIVTATYVCADGKLIQGNYFSPSNLGRGPQIVTVRPTRRCATYTVAPSQSRSLGAGRRIANLPLLPIQGYI